MIYAPVVIPTLNRYEHLRQCLESLSNCTLAEETEVYIALDYPPSDKYVEGWQKTRDYLHSVGNMNFKQIHLIERTENYGTWNPGDKGNAKHLIADISEKYDRYIFTEDDNIFSPCFLEYMNKGLELFKDDDKVFAISGYRWWFPVKYENNTFFRQNVDYTPWGEGKWVRKNNDNFTGEWFNRQLTIRNIFSLLMRGEITVLGSLFEFARKEHRNDILIDQHMRVIMALKEYEVIIPVISLVKNIGLDGSGVTMPQNSGTVEDLYDSIELSTDKHFEFTGTGYEYYKYNHRLYKRGKEWRSQWYYWKRLLKKIIKFVIYR
jgi:hypothetical protein